MHRGPRDGGDPERRGPGRRGDHAVVHVRLDGERVRAPWRDPGLRRHPSRTRSTSTTRRSRRRSRRGRRRSSRSTTPASAATWTRSWTSPPGTTSLVIEDAAQGLLADYRGRPLGGIGHMAALSFHETKNVISGEGGALLVNDPTVRRTRRDHLGEGHEPEPVLPRPGRQVHVGRRRLVVPARRDHRRLPLGADGGVEQHHVAPPGDLGHVPRGVRGAGANGPRAPADRADRIARTTPTCITCCCPTSRDGPPSSTGSRPTASSRCSTTSRCTRRRSGDRPGVPHGDMSVTDDASDRLVRLPLWLGLEDEQRRVIDQVIAAAQAG